MVSAQDQQKEIIEKLSGIIYSCVPEHYCMKKISKKTDKTLLSNFFKWNNFIKNSNFPAAKKGMLKEDGHVTQILSLIANF